MMLFSASIVNVLIWFLLDRSAVVTFITHVPETCKRNVQPPNRIFPVRWDAPEKQTGGTSIF